MTTTRRFWSLSPSAPPLVTRAPRLEEGVTRRWFLGALGLVVAAPSVLVPTGASRVDIIDPANMARILESLDPSLFTKPTWLWGIPYHHNPASTATWLGLERTAGG